MSGAAAGGGGGGDLREGSGDKLLSEPPGPGFVIDPRMWVEKTPRFGVVVQKKATGAAKRALSEDLIRHGGINPIGPLDKEDEFVLRLGEAREEDVRVLLLSVRDTFDPKGLSGAGCEFWESESVDGSIVGVVRREVETKLDDLSTTEMLEKLLPSGIVIPSSYESCGPIVHLNLTEEQMPWRYAIGAVFLCKIEGKRGERSRRREEGALLESQARTARVKRVLTSEAKEFEDVVAMEIRTEPAVVTKTSSIATKFRTFPMEIIAGTGVGEIPPPPLVVDEKENGVTLRFDYRDVYWNSRLKTEHERLVEAILEQGCATDGSDVRAGMKRSETSNSSIVVADAMAGVGPFAIPLGSRDAVVLANDLNPASYKWLRFNVLANGVSSKVSCFNEDAASFLHRLATSSTAFDHVIMNLPASAPTFLPSLCNAFDRASWPRPLLPTVHCYSFGRGDTPAHGAIDAAKLVLENLSLEPENESTALEKAAQAAKTAETRTPKDHQAEITTATGRDAEAVAAAGPAVFPNHLSQEMQPRVRIVRHVAPSKWMYLLSFRIPASIGFRK